MKIEELLNKKEAIIVRREVKKIAGSDAHLQVFVVDGKRRRLAPRIANKSLKRGFYTLSGDPISHPSAYSKKGFPNMVYICDPRYVEVGIEWLARFAGTKSLIGG